jgi:aminopeptidase
VQHSTRLKEGDKVLIEATHVPEAALAALIEEASAVGAIPIVEMKSLRLQRTWLRSGTPQQVDARTRLLGEIELARMEKMDAYIGLRGSDNITEMSDVSVEIMGLFEQNLVKPVHIERRVKHTRWCVLRWPNGSMAQQAGMSTEAFEDFYFRVCLADYARMNEAAKPLQNLMNRTDRVHILSKDTDLCFSIKDIAAIPCCGDHNIPDGECFTAPVKDSVEGHIHFNSPSIYRGTPFDDIRLTFKQGQVVEFNCNNNEALQAILDSDEGARSIGEFAIGFHPHIQKPMRDILFDEKIRGSLHLALGQCYEETENGNRSKIHWDLVLRQEEGGEIYFDDVLIRKDGRFVLPELQALNPEHLAGVECL